MILKAERIADLLRSGSDHKADDPFVISPQPDLEALKTSGSASIDLRLGTWFVTLRQSRMGYLRVDDSHDNNTHVKLTKHHYVPFGDEYFLHPGNFVLGITLEWMRFPRNIAAYVVGRSSWGRRGLIIATATGVHPGFKGVLTLELTNLGEMPIAIKPGMKICQLFLHSVEASTAPYIDLSQFAGFRKPALGKVEPDSIAKKLERARQNKS